MFWQCVRAEAVTDGYQPTLPGSPGLSPAMTTWTCQLQKPRAPYALPLWGAGINQPHQLSATRPHEPRARYCFPSSISIRVIKYSRGTIELVSMYSSRAW
jgi:hypothetical protein